MTFIQTVSPDVADIDVTAMFQRQQSHWGYVPNYAKVFCHRPEVLARWGQLLAEIKRPMDIRRFELVTFVAAHALKNSACALAHGQALQAFFTEQQICEIAEGRCSGSLSEAEQVMVGFVRQLVDDASAITADQIRVLGTHGFSEAEIFDIAACAAGRAFFTKLLDALGVEADSPFLALEATLRRTLTVGRPIATHPCTTVTLPAPSHFQGKDTIPATCIHSDPNRH